MKKTILIAGILAMLGSNAFGDDQARRNAEKVIELKDGSTLYIFKDKKMAMQDKNGRTTRMEPGHVMETKDGDKIIMIGNEVARLDFLIKHGHQGAWSREPR